MGGKTRPRPDQDRIIAEVFGDETIEEHKRITTILDQMKDQLGIDKRYNDIWYRITTSLPKAYGTDTVEEALEKIKEGNFKGNTPATSTNKKSTSAKKRITTTNINRGFPAEQHKKEVFSIHTATNQMDRTITSYLHAQARIITNYAEALQFINLTPAQAKEKGPEIYKKYISFVSNDMKIENKPHYISLIHSHIGPLGKIVFPLYEYAAIQTDENSISSQLYDATSQAIKNTIDAKIEKSNVTGIDVPSLAAIKYIAKTTPTEKNITTLQEEINVLLGSYEELKEVGIKIKEIDIPCSNLLHTPTTTSSES